MNAKQLERASYLAAHAVLSANVSAPHLGTPGARRSYTIDAIANKIRSVFELHCSAFDETGDWQEPAAYQAPSEADPVDLNDPIPVSNKLELVLQKMH